MPDEVGHWKRRRNGKIVLEPDNLDALAAASMDCFGIELQKYRSWIRPSAGGRRVVGRSLRRERRGSSSVPVAVKSTIFFNGSADPTSSVEAPIRSRPARQCEEPLQLDCRPK
jgi:hypothetical protein